MMQARPLVELQAPKPVTPMDRFNEALSLVPLVHVPVVRDQHMLVVGASAVPAAQAAMRYPTFIEIVINADLPTPIRDPRVHVLPSLTTLLPSWKADLIVVAQTSVTPELLQSLRAHCKQRTVVVVAVPVPTQVRALKESMRRLWPIVQPYREHLPELTYFLMASDAPLDRHRPVPGHARHLTDKYLPALFTFAKDEYSALYGAQS
jgi:hypothetical protein